MLIFLNSDYLITKIENGSIPIHTGDDTQTFTVVLPSALATGVSLVASFLTADNKKIGNIISSPVVSTTNGYEYTFAIPQVCLKQKGMMQVDITVVTSTSKRNVASFKMLVSYSSYVDDDILVIGEDTVTSVMAAVSSCQTAVSTEATTRQAQIDTVNCRVNTTNTNVGNNATEITKIKNGTTVVEKAKKDANGNVINTTYETQAHASSTYETQTHASNTYATLTSLQALVNRINGVLDSTDVDLDQLSELVAYIKENRLSITSMLSGKVNVSDVIDNLLSYETAKPLSANQGRYLKSLVDTKQAIISDLTTIRNGAQKGATALQSIDVVDGLTSSDSGKPLSANQGRALNVAVGSVNQRVDTLTTTVNGKLNTTQYNTDKTAQSQKDTQQDLDIVALQSELAETRELLNGYVYDTTSVNVSHQVPKTATVGSTTYNIYDNANGMIERVYGGTKKSENLLVLQDVAETTTNGITYSIKNGVITLNGTASGWTTLDLFEGTLSGSYSFAPFFSGTTSASNIIRIAENGTYSQFTKSYNITTSNTTKIQFYCDSNTTFNNVTIKPMLVRGSTAPTTFERGFNGLHSVAFKGVKFSCRNLLNIANAYAQVWNTIIPVSLKANTTYTFYSNGNAGSYGLGTVENATEYSTYKASTTRTFTTTNAVDKLLFAPVTYNQHDIGNYDLMLVEGSVAQSTYLPYISPTTLLNNLTLENGVTYPITLRGVNNARDYLQVSQNASGTFDVDKVVLIGNRAYQSGDESNANVLTDTNTTNYVLTTPTTTRIASNLTLSQVKAITQSLGFVDIINDDVYSSGSTDVTVIYKKFN